MLTQMFPLVKSIFGDLPGIGRIRLDLAERIFITVMTLDKRRIYGRDKDAGVQESLKDRFMIVAGCLHDDFGLAVKTANKGDQLRESFYRMNDIERLPHGFARRAQDCDSALAFRNINTNSVQHEIHLQR